jgi:hypothetical protein
MMDDWKGMLGWQGARQQAVIITGPFPSTGIQANLANKAKTLGVTV